MGAIETITSKEGLFHVDLKAILVCDTVRHQSNSHYREEDAGWQHENHHVYGEHITASDLNYSLSAGSPPLSTVPLPGVEPYNRQFVADGPWLLGTRDPSIAYRCFSGARR